MRFRVQTVAIVGLFIVVMSSTVAIAAENDKPNIVFLLADDQNLSSVGCYGNPDVQTPRMDALARDGVVFDRHYNTTAIC